MKKFEKRCSLTTKVDSRDEWSSRKTGGGASVKARALHARQITRSSRFDRLIFEATHSRTTGEHLWVLPLTLMSRGPQTARRCRWGHISEVRGVRNYLSLLPSDCPAVRDSDFTDNERDTNAIKRRIWTNEHCCFTHDGLFWPIETTE